MGLVIPWTATLAMIEVYSIFIGCPLRLPGVMVIVVVGDWAWINLNFMNKCTVYTSLTILPWKFLAGISNSITGSSLRKC